MPISVTVVTEPDRLKDLEDTWNRFIHNNATNPFFLTGFVNQLMTFRRSQGWSPMLLVLFIDRTLVGIAPLMTMAKFGIRSVRFLHGEDLSPDFILDANYRELCIRSIVKFVFDVLHCQFMSLTLPAESPNLNILKDVCKQIDLYLQINDASTHRIVPIQCSWDEFQLSKGHHFGKHVKQMEKRLHQLGSWKVMHLDGVSQPHDVIQRIMNIEKRSWKEGWRKVNKKKDDFLPIVLRGSTHAARTEPDFQWGAYFLELSGEPLSYALVLEYKQVAYLIKTSFDNRYKTLSPGFYIVNESIHELFDKGQVKVMEFHTNLPFMRRWTSTYLSRARALMCRKKVFPLFFAFMLRNEIVRVVLNEFFEGRPIRIRIVRTGTSRPHITLF